MKLSNPAPGRPVTSGYGYRVHPISKVRKLHRGIDYGGIFDVLAAGDGVVTYIGWSPSKRTGGGHVVKIDHGDCVTVYYHGSHRTGLRLGQRVSAGDTVYVSGSTGASTGPHLHFEVRKRGGLWGTDVDPGPWFAGVPSCTALPVNGRLDRDTIRALQRALADKGLNPGRIDGLMSSMTVKALQTMVHVRADGRFGPVTRRAVQTWLRVKADGKWGKQTLTALQLRLNAGTL